MIVDALVPPSLHLALPNLRSGTLWQCDLSPAAATSQLDRACSTLQRLALRVWGEAWLPAQLAQLSSLRGLTSLAVDNRTPAAFLPSLSQLTALELGSDVRDCDFPTQRPTAQWAAALCHVAQCTRLRSLALPAATAGELRPVAMALTQLRRLCLNYSFADEMDVDEMPDLDSDAMVELLLGLTQLTSLDWVNALPYVMRRSHADRPCSWRELTFGDVGVQQLLHLPLCSLTSPVALETLFFATGDSVADAQRVVRVLVGEGGPGVRWGASGCWVHFNDRRTDPVLFVHGATPADTPAALLRSHRAAGSYSCLMAQCLLRPWWSWRGTCATWRASPLSG